MIFPCTEDCLAIVAGDLCETYGAHSGSVLFTINIPNDFPIRMHFFIIDGGYVQFKDSNSMLVYRIDEGHFFAINGNINFCRFIPRRLTFICMN